MNRKLQIEEVRVVSHQISEVFQIVTKNEQDLNYWGLVVLISIIIKLSILIVSFKRPFLIQDITLIGIVQMKVR